MTRNDPSEKVRVRIEERTGRIAFRLIRADTLERNYQRVKTKTGDFFGKKVPVATKQGIRRRYVKPSTLLAEFEFEEGAFRRRKKPLADVLPGPLTVRLVVVYGVVRSGREYAEIGEWYWYLDSDLPEMEIVPKILAAVEKGTGATLFRVGGRDRVRIGTQRFEAKKGPLTVDLDTLVKQVEERSRKVEWS